MVQSRNFKATRVIDGKRYRRYIHFNNKSEAIQEAIKWRKRGYRIRVVKTSSKEWVIYGR